MNGSAAGGSSGTSQGGQADYALMVANGRRSAVRSTDLSVDNEVEYRPFARDYGPLNLAYTVHGVCTIQDIIKVSLLQQLPLEGRRLGT